MKNLITIILTLTITITVWSQSYEPQILILAPSEFKYEKPFENDVLSINKKLSGRVKNSEEADYLESDDFISQPENIQRMILSEVKFSQTQDFSKQVSFIAFQYLSYRFFERFENLLILLSDKKSDGSLKELSKIAGKEKMQYVLNFSHIQLFERDGMAFAEISVQLYDNVSQTFLINSEYIGGWNNPGFEFSCNDQSIECTINNALSKALGDVIYQVASNSPTIKREHELAQLRFNELIINYYLKPNNTDFLKPIIPQSDNNIDLKDQYQILIDPTQTKFVAFFIEEVSAQDFKNLKVNERDKQVNIISSGDFRDAGFLDNIPQNYAYIVKGVKFNNKWYFEKSNVTYFEAENLEEGKQVYFYNLAMWNFFKDDSTEFNPDFWETSLFNKINDLKQDPDWDKYGDTIWKKQEEYNRPYIGYYEIVANQLKKDAEN